LDETRTYTLATSDFLVTRGGDGYTMFGQANVLIDADSAKRDAEIFEAAIQSAPGGVIAPKIEGRINRRD
jgi:2',3'-cyclic-nucleotide 2'-phosphodiesterase (5'-nucleotidase family)